MRMRFCVQVAQIRVFVPGALRERFLAIPNNSNTLCLLFALSKARAYTCSCVS